MHIAAGEPHQSSNLAEALQMIWRERRISRGREFNVLKFRVLREDVLAEAARKGEYARLHEADHSNLTRAGRIIKRVYERYGFEPLETPAVESAKLEPVKSEPKAEPAKAESTPELRRSTD